MRMTRLALDPEGAPAVAEIFAWRIGERLSYATIAARLNIDLVRYPPAVPTDPRRAVGHWTTSMVRACRCHTVGGALQSRTSRRRAAHPSRRWLRPQQQRLTTVSLSHGNTGRHEPVVAPIRRCLRCT